MFSSEQIQNEVLNINSKHTSSEYHFEGHFHANIYPYSQIFEQLEEEFISIKVEQQTRPNKFSS